MVMRFSAAAVPVLLQSTQRKPGPFVNTRTCRLGTTSLVRRVFWC